VTLAIRLIAVLAVATLGLVAGASARNKARDLTPDPVITGSIRTSAPQHRRVAPTSSTVVQQVQHGPDRRAEIIGQGFSRVKRARD